VKAVGAGSEVDAWCTKCRLDLGHRVVAEVHGRPKRVICMTCGSEHNFRSPRGQSGSAATRTRKGGSRATQKTDRLNRKEGERLRDWRERVSDRTQDAFATYSPDQTYTRDQLLYHRKFGAGYVVGLLEGGKLSVMFQEGKKILVHASG
jgi:hypothetical protein